MGHVAHSSRTAQSKKEKSPYSCTVTANTSHSETQARQRQVRAHDDNDTTAGRNGSSC